DICNQIPGCVGEFIPLCHLGLLALMAVYFTENRISWVYVQSLVMDMYSKLLIGLRTYPLGVLRRSTGYALTACHFAKAAK
ncbi:hypothetical protein, partial [Pseudomonas saxonica]|uniref:hypothetical protein n=1 Tax=Pseudomonas saxonica TaxID=2600598 RepID=UPI001F4513A4